MGKPYISPILEKIRRNDISQDLTMAMRYAQEYIGQVDTIRVYPEAGSIDNLHLFDSQLPEMPIPNSEILTKLHTVCSPATVAQTGGRYFGFVCGGILPSALCSKWLTDAWDQNPAMFVLSPISAKLEQVCERWLREILNLPVETVCGFVSGSSTAIIGAILAARNYLIEKQGYSVPVKGLKESPDIRVVIGEEAHSTVIKAISILGIGIENVIKVPTDDQGRICPDKMPVLDDKTLLILQAGNVNSGAYDDFDRICGKAKECGAWIHIDGAFGLWAAASEKFTHLTKGMELADSWSVDGHKTLNAPYDNGILLCRHREALVKAEGTIGKLF